MTYFKRLAILVASEMAIKNSNPVFNRKMLGALSNRLAARWRLPLLTPLVWGALLCGSGAVEAQPLESTRVVLLPTPHAPPESPSKLPARLATAIAQGVRKRVAHIPHLPVRAATAAESGCGIVDYECKVKLSLGAAKSGCSSGDEDCKILRAGQTVHWVVDVQVQDNGNGTYYIVSYLYDVQHPNNTLDNNLSFGTPGGSRHLSTGAEETLIEQIAERVAGLIQQVPKDAQPAADAAPPPATKVGTGSKVVDEPLSLEVQVVGPGRIVSQPTGISCGSDCSHKFPALGEQMQVSLRAVPTGAASAVIWSGSPCQNSILTDPRRCDLPASGRLKVKAEFERSARRKIATGVLGGLAGAGLVITGVMFGLAGSSAGSCTDHGTMSNSCLYNTAATGFLTAGLTVGLGVGAALVWWLPTARESK